MKKSLYTTNQTLYLTQLRDLRLGSGLTQVELAAKLDKPQSFVSKYESGERRLDVLELREICLALGSSLCEFSATLDRQLR